MHTATLHVEGRLVPDVDAHAANLPGSWFVTFGLGKPAANTYTEIALTPEVQAAGHPEHVIDAAVREVIDALYGRAWAFHYRPDQYADAIERHGSRRRERAVITALEVWE